MEYKLSYNKPATQYLSIELSFKTTAKNEVEIVFPAWRPGRYQLGDFAKNVKSFKVYNDKGKALAYRKTEKNRWLVLTEGSETLKVSYQYFAEDLNAGSTYLDEQQLYVNPVNCFAYVEELQEQPCSVDLEIPDEYKIACSMQKNGKTLKAKDYHELVDSPFICSEGLTKKSYKIKGTTFFIWFNGEYKVDWEKILKDFKAFTNKQVEHFNKFPVKEYHFLYQILPFRAYHGVEHLASTVCILGPSYELMGDRYDSFLGVSSHELYHAWNIKAIRPAEMYPYDYSKENYSRLGYVAEGVTTYMGDIFLMKGKVFTHERYFQELATLLNRHFDNYGRLNYSVAESSFDTWLDGYEQGAPGRKVSIYTEGALLAFITDTLIMKHTGNQKSLHDVMRILFERFAEQNKGYTESDYQNKVEEVCGEELGWLFEDYYYGTTSFEALLYDAMDYLGLEMKKTEAGDYCVRVLGMKSFWNDRREEIRTIAPGSPADMAGIMPNDKIIAVNGYRLENDLDQWLDYFKDEDITLTVFRSGQLIRITLPQCDRTFFRDYEVKRLEKPSKAQREAFNKWSGSKD